MSHPAEAMQRQALRELAAVPRTFRSVQGALLFYVTYRASRGARAIDVNGGGCSAPDSVRDERAAT